jgi:hypothetical protein
MRRRSRTRSRRGSGLPISRLAIFLLVIGVVVSGATLIPSTSFTSQSAERSAQLGVVADEQAVVGLDINEEIRPGDRRHLLTVSNQFDRPATVRVTLRDTSDGTLYVNGRYAGNQATVQLAESGQRATQEIEIRIDGFLFGSRPGELQVDAQTTATTASMQRETRLCGIFFSGCS